MLTKTGVQNRTPSESGICGELSLIAKDLSDIASLEDRLRLSVSELDHSRLLIVLAACEKSRTKLNAVLPRLLKQATDADLSADLVVGLDHGTNHRCITDSAAVMELMTDVQVGIERCMSDIRDPKDGGHRLFVVEPHDVSHVDGKNGVLKGVGDWMEESMLSGAWAHPPANMLQCDDDTWLYPSNHYIGNGLSSLMDEKERHSLQLIGARWHNVEYANVGEGALKVQVPNPTKPGSEAHRWLDESQHSWYRFMPGGATLGDTPALTSIRHQIGHRYIGAISDDLLTTMFADRMGKRWDIADHSYTFNEARDPNSQILRWLQGTFSMRAHLGRSNFTGLYKTCDLPPVLRTMPSHQIEGLLSQAIYTRNDITKPATWGS